MKLSRALMAAVISGLVCAQTVSAQEELLAAGVATQQTGAESVYLFGPASTSTLRAAADDPVMHSLSGDASVLSIEPIEINPRLLAGSNESFFMNFAPGLVLPVSRLNSYAINDDYVAWTGEVDIGIDSKLENGVNPNQVVFVRSNEGRVFGQIRIEGQVFEVVTMSKGGYLLVERDFSTLGYADDTPVESPFVARQPVAVDQDDGSTRATSTIRVLQAASPQAISSLGGNGPTVDRMNFFIAQSNQVYANNGLQIVLQDAGKYNSGANERSTASSNVSGLGNPSDGYLDTFYGATRNAQSADLVGLIVRTSSDPGICGIADGIGVGANDAFFVVKYSCTNFTFVHEMGHLFGARHDNDPTTSPFSYGHGFVSSAGNFRTIMAVSSNPQPRIGLFSTDDQTFNGITAGNSSSRDNERVHDVRRGTVAGFR